MAKFDSDLGAGDRKAVVQLDLRGTPCPLNFIRTKLRLEQLDPGAALEVWLDAGEPVEQVPDSLKISGYTVETITPCEDFFVLVVCKPHAAT